MYVFAVITPSQPFQSQKQDLIAELKMSKDILGIKKMKVERVKMEEKQEKELVTEICKQFSVENFVGQVRAVVEISIVSDAASLHTFSQLSNLGRSLASGV